MLGRPIRGLVEAVLSIPIGMGLGYLGRLSYFGTGPVSSSLLGLAAGFASFVIFGWCRMRVLVPHRGAGEDGSEPGRARQMNELGLDIEVGSRAEPGAESDAGAVAAPG